MIITKTKNKSNLMKTLLDQESFQKEENSLIEGSVINIDKSSIFIDLRPIGTGIIYGKEFSAVKEIIRKMKVGDIVKAKIMEAENENGYIELSLKEARQALIWNEAEKAIKELNGKEVSGRAIVVNEAKPREERPSGGRGGFDRERRRY